MTGLDQTDVQTVRRCFRCFTEDLHGRLIQYLHFLSNLNMPNNLSPLFFSRFFFFWTFTSLHSAVKGPQMMPQPLPSLQQTMQVTVLSLVWYFAKYIECAYCSQSTGLRVFFLLDLREEKMKSSSCQVHRVIMSQGGLNQHYVT